MSLQRLIAFLLVFAFALLASACAELTLPGRFTPEATATAVRDVLITRQRPPLPQIPVPLPSAIPATPTVATATPEPTTASAPSIPSPATASSTGFCCLRFTIAPDTQPVAIFPAGTETIHAIWDYAALNPGDRVRRIWFRDDLIWITREETWDWETYGAEGTVRDVAVYDFEGDGLLPASYRLQLYLNDVLQEEGTFTISSP